MTKAEKFIVYRLIQKWLRDNEDKLSLYVHKEFVKNTGKKIDKIYIDEEIGNYFL